ncbi:homoserine kinase [bacterium]|nr:homoserine kinase [bacterium]
MTPQSRAPRALTVTVPASTSNLGPGYDCLGCAFRLYNKFTFELGDHNAQHELSFDGPESQGLEPSQDNLILSSARTLYEAIDKSMPTLKVQVQVNVPHPRGLGSSSTAVVAGLVGANALAGAPLDRRELLNLAAKIEGHPDNVAPAMVGGLTAALMDDFGDVVLGRWRPHKSVAFVILSPDYGVQTKEARAVLPDLIPHADAVANLARVPLLIEALQRGDLSHLSTLMRDKLHEPYRETLYPNFEELRSAALRAGASATCLSGAGPSMLAVTESTIAENVATAWSRALTDLGHTGRCRVLEPDYNGCQVRHG